MPKDNIPGRDAKLNSMLQMVFSNNPNESWAAVSKVRSYLEARGRTPRDIEAFTGDDFAGGLMAELRQRQNTIDRLRNEKLELIKRKKEVGRPKRRERNQNLGASKFLLTSLRNWSAIFATEKKARTKYFRRY